MKKFLSLLLIGMLFIVPMAAQAEAYVSEDGDVSFELAEGTSAFESTNEKGDERQFVLVPEDGAYVYGFNFIYKVSTSTTDSVDMVGMAMELLNAMSAQVDVSVANMSFSLVISSMEGALIMDIVEETGTMGGYIKWASPLTLVAIALSTTDEPLTQDQKDDFAAFMETVTLPEAEEN